MLGPDHRGHSTPSTVASTTRSLWTSLSGEKGTAPVHGWLPANGLLVHCLRSPLTKPRGRPLLSSVIGARSSLKGPLGGGAGPGGAPRGPRGQGPPGVCGSCSCSAPDRAGLDPGARGSALLQADLDTGLSPRRRSGVLPPVPRLALRVTCLTPALGLRHRCPWPSSVLESCFKHCSKGCAGSPQNP